MLWWLHTNPSDFASVSNVLKWGNRTLIFTKHHALSKYLIQSNQIIPQISTCSRRLHILCWCHLLTIHALCVNIQSSKRTKFIGCHERASSSIRNTAVVFIMDYACSGMDETSVTGATCGILPLRTWYITARAIAHWYSWRTMHEVSSFN